MYFRTVTRRLASPISNNYRSLSHTRIMNVSSFAKITLVGRLGDTPEAQTTSTGKEILKYSVATDSGRGENKKPSWFKVTYFTSEGPQRDLVAGLEKGTLVYVEGEASLNQYQDSDGKSRTGLNIIQRQLEILSSRKPPAPES